MVASVSAVRSRTYHTRQAVANYHGQAGEPPGIWLGSGSAESVAAGAAAGAKLVSPTWFENVLLVTDETPGLAGRLEEQGALGVFENLHFAGISFAGCIGASLR